MVVAGCCCGGSRATAYRHRKAAQDGPAEPLPGLLSENDSVNDAFSKQGRVHTEGTENHGEALRKAEWRFARSAFLLPRWPLSGPRCPLCEPFLTSLLR